jgi:hypothetical protein
MDEVKKNATGELLPRQQGQQSTMIDEGQGSHRRRHHH